MLLDSGTWEASRTCRRESMDKRANVLLLYVGFTLKTTILCWLIDDPHFPGKRDRCILALHLADAGVGGGPKRIGTWGAGRSASCGLNSPKNWLVPWAFIGLGKQILGLWYLCSFNSSVIVIGYSFKNGGGRSITNGQLELAMNRWRTAFL